jgi:hypothetical protein
MSTKSMSSSVLFLLYSAFMAPSFSNDSTSVPHWYGIEKRQKLAQRAPPCLGPQRCPCVQNNETACKPKQTCCRQPVFAIGSPSVCAIATQMAAWQLQGWWLATVPIVPSNSLTNLANRSARQHCRCGPIDHHLSHWGAVTLRFL